MTAFDQGKSEVCSHSCPRAGDSCGELWLRDTRDGWREEKTVAKKGKGERVFKTLKPKLMRKKISAGEIGFGAAFLLVLVLAGAWVLAQRDNFDPADRDISFKTLQEDAVEDTLYRPPLKRWVEPGQQVGARPAVDLGIFPSGLIEDGWTLDGRVETYDAENLYEKINGAAEQYLAFGFRQLHYVTLSDGDGYLTIELYDQGEFPNALGIFAAQRDVDREIRTEGPVWYYPTPAGAVGGTGKYYFKISGDSSSPAILAKAKALIGQLSGLPASASGKPQPYAILTERLGLTLDRIAYQRNDVFQYEFLTDVWFGAADTATETRWFIHEAAGEDEARRLFERLVEEQLYDYEVLDRDADGALLRHQYLKTLFGARRRGALLFGVDGAEDAAGARALLDRLDEVTRVEETTYPES